MIACYSAWRARSSPREAYAAPARRCGHRCHHEARDARGHPSVRRGSAAELLKSSHPEVRRRAVIAVGRIVNPAGRALLVGRPQRRRLGHPRDGGVFHGPVEGSRCRSVAIRVADGQEHAHAGRSRGGAGARQDQDARRARGHSRGISSAPLTAPTAAPVVGEALLALGRFTTREDLAPILPWT